MTMNQDFKSSWTEVLKALKLINTWTFVFQSELLSSKTF